MSSTAIAWWAGQAAEQPARANRHRRWSASADQPAIGCCSVWASAIGRRPKHAQASSQRAEHGHGPTPSRPKTLGQRS
jgi:hypothetical protein